MTKLKPLSVNRLHEVVVQELEKRILHGDFEEGEMLPSEKALAEMLNVGRRAVREALRTLQAKGLVDIRMGVGTFVVRNDLDSYLESLLDNISAYLATKKAELDHILELRGLLEKYGLTKIAENPDAKIFEAFDNYLQQQRQAFENDDLQAYQEHHINYHIFIVDQLHNPIISMFHTQLLKLLIDKMRKNVKNPKTMEMAISEHEEVVSLLKESNKEKVLAAFDRHLASTRKNFLSMRKPDES